MVALPRQGAPCLKTSDGWQTPFAQTTLLVLAAVMDLDESLLLSCKEFDGFDETIVDRGHAWVEYLVEANPFTLGRIVADLELEAARVYAGWVELQEESALEFRRAWVEQGTQRAAVRAQRFTGHFLQALRRGHGARCFRTARDGAAAGGKRTALICRGAYGRKLSCVHDA